jgi:hypothetical protein
MALTRSRITELASAIHHNTIEIDDYIAGQNLLSPSFAVNAAPDIPLPPHLAAVCAKLLQDTSELPDLLMGPLRYLTHLASPTVCSFYMEGIPHNRINDINPAQRSY